MRTVLTRTLGLTLAVFMALGVAPALPEERAGDVAVLASTYACRQDTHPVGSRRHHAGALRARRRDGGGSER
jgi:hypothetical protein